MQPSMSLKYEPSSEPLHISYQLVEGVDGEMDLRESLDYLLDLALLEVYGSGFRVQGSGCRVQGSGFKVQGAGFRVQG